MSVVIIGGHDRMVSQYKKICKEFKCKAKVFTQMSTNMDKKIGCPDLLVLFTNTVSHKMVKCALDEVGSSTESMTAPPAWSAAIPAAGRRFLRFWRMRLRRRCKKLPLRPGN